MFYFCFDPLSLIIIVFMNIIRGLLTERCGIYQCLHHWWKWYPFPKNPQSIPSLSVNGRALWAFLSVHKEMVTAWILSRSCIGNHSCCVITTVTAMACSGDRVSQHSSPSSSSCILSAFSFTTFPESFLKVERV